MMSIYDHFRTGTIKRCLYLASFKILKMKSKLELYFQYKQQLIHLITNTKQKDINYTLLLWWKHLTNDHLAK